jgi:hypothetical protein
MTVISDVSRTAAFGRKRQSTNGPALQTLASGRHFSMAGFGRVRSMRTNGHEETVARVASNDNSSANAAVGSRPVWRPVWIRYRS